MFESIFLIIVITGTVSAIGVIIKNQKEKSSILFSLFFLVVPFVFIQNKWLQLGFKNVLASFGYLLLLTYNGLLLFIIFQPNTRENTEENIISKYLVSTIFFIMSILPVEIIGMDFKWWTRKKEQNFWNANAFYRLLTKSPWDKILFSHAIIGVIASLTWLPTYVYCLKLLKKTIKIENKRNETIFYSFSSGLIGLIYGLVMSLIILFLQIFY